MLLLLVGAGVLIAVWALLVAWIAKLAQGRGRFAIGWALAAGIAGVLGFGVGATLLERAPEVDGVGSLVLLTLMPLVGGFAPMLAIGLVLRRAPIRVAHRDEWPVHFVNRGPGRISIDAGVVRFAWPGEAREARLDQLRSVDVDGECVRIGCADELELVVLMTGRPETPAGRRQQSLALARRLLASRGPIPRAQVIVRARPAP